MKTDLLARSYLERGRQRLLAAEGAQKRKAYPEVVRFSQECVEMSLKAALRCVGVEHPKSHDVGGFLTFNQNLFPEWFQGSLPDLARISSELSLQRAPSMYGLEIEGKGPGELFEEQDGVRALDSARRVHDVVVKLIGELLG